jgi:hypothetical protein
MSNPLPGPFESLRDTRRSMGDGTLSGRSRIATPYDPARLRKAVRPRPPSGDSYTPDVLVAADDSGHDAKAATRFVCSGDHDERTLEAAKAWLEERNGSNPQVLGRIVLAAGTYELHGPADLSGCMVVGGGGRTGRNVEVVLNDNEPADVGSVALEAEGIQGLYVTRRYSDGDIPSGVDYEFWLSAKVLADVEAFAGVVEVGFDGHVNGLRCARLVSAGGSVQAVNVHAGRGMPDDGLYLTGGQAQTSNVTVEGQVQGGGGFYLRARRTGSLVGSGGNADVDVGELYRSGEEADAIYGLGGNSRVRVGRLGGNAVLAGGTSFYSFAEMAWGDVNIVGADVTLADTRMTGFGAQSLTLNANGVRLLHVDLGGGTFVDNGRTYFACGCVGIPNTCDCGGGSGGHGPAHALDDLTDVDLAATPVADPAHLLGLDGATWKRATVTGGGGGGDLSDDDPLPDGTAAPGTSDEASRSDHVHPTSGGGPHTHDEYAPVGHTHPGSDGTVRMVVLHDYGTGPEPVTDDNGVWLYGAFPGLEH